MAFVSFPWDAVYEGTWADALQVFDENLMKLRAPDSHPSIHIKTAILALLNTNVDLKEQRKGTISSNTPALDICLDRQCDSSFAANFADKVLPWMGKLLATAQEQFADKKVQLLVQIDSKEGRKDDSCRIPQTQVTVLMVMGFLSLFPGRFGPKTGQKKVPHELPGNPLGRPLEMQGFNFFSLYMCGGEANASKVRCLMEYFTIMERDWATVAPDGLEIEIVRSSCPIASVSELLAAAQVPLATIDYRHNFPIENCDGCLQADFANEWIGGGVLRSGCVQEEIRMMVSTELLVSLLICERMLDHESITIHGCAQFCAFSGYGDSFRFVKERPVPSSVAPSTPERRVRNVSVVAFDALNFSWIEDKLAQFKQELIDREFGKAFAAFASPPTTPSTTAPVEGSASAATEVMVPFATGNWGCGVFEGHLELKFLIQWIAASACRRPLVYCAIGPEAKMAGIKSLADKLTDSSVTAAEVYDVIISYLAQCVKARKVLHFTKFVLGAFDKL